MTRKPLSALRSFVILLSITFAAVPAVGSPPHRSLRFQRISVGDGLSQAAVNVILQDRRGFMWFGTQEGLNRFDGNDFITFQHDPADPTSLSHDSVRAIVEDNDGVLWVGTDNGGLARFDEGTQSFTHFRHDPTDPNSLGSDRVRALHLGANGVLWIGTDGGGLSRFDRSTGNFTRFVPNPEDPFSLSQEHVRTVLQDSTGRLWAGTHAGGLNLLDTNTGRFRRFQHDPADENSISDDGIFSLHESSDGALWIGTGEGGLNRLGPGSSVFERFANRPGDPSSLSKGAVRAIFEDRSGLMLVGTDQGLNKWNPQSRGFTAYRHDPSDVYSLSADRIDAIYQDRGGVVWLGTRIGINRWNPTTGSFPHYKARMDVSSELSNAYVTSFTESVDGTLWVGTQNGLNALDRQKQTFKRFFSDPRDPTSLAGNIIGAVMADSKGGLWVGTMGQGLDYLPPKSTRFRHYSHAESDPNSLSINVVTTVYEDRSGTVWVGTYRGGLNRYDPSHDGFIRYRHDPANGSSLSSDRVVAIFEDSRGDLWIGTDGGGLSRLDRDRGSFTTWTNDPDDPKSLSSSHIWTITESSDGDLYIGTQGGGLNRWTLRDREAGRAVFSRYFKNHGLLSAVIYGALWDDNGQLWLSSNRGLSVFDPKEGTFRNYNTSHGLQSEEFNSAAALRTRDGYMFFGGINGFNAFHPANIRTNTHVPPVVLTGVLKLNGAATFDKPVADLKAIELDHKDTMVTFDFAALDYTAPEKNRYRYILEGFDRDWVDLGNRNRAVYTNLDAGNYILKVQGSNNDGVWNREGFSLAVRALPPPWATWWAYGAYVSAACLLALYYFQGQTKKRLRTLELAKANESLEKEITRRLAKEQALFREKAKAQEYFQVAEVIMLVLDTSGHVVLINSKGTELLGYGESELIGKNWFDKIVVESTEIRDRFARNEAPDCTEYEVVTRTGDLRVIAWQCTYLSNEDGSPAGTLSSGSDITEIKRLQEEKENAESASRAKSQFLANMSHEIRTPMNGVLGMLELLMNTELNDRQANCARKARLSAVNLLGILNEILDFSKIEAGKFELEEVDFDLRDLADEVIHLFREPARQKGLQLRTTIARTLPTAVRADPTRLRQVLINLVGNAVKFTDSGYVELEIHALDVTDNEIRLGFSVQDSGIGIAQQDSETIFESFQQADGTTTRTYGGTGLGLAISKAFIEMMGGEIGVDSTPGEGSTFWFQISLARQSAERKADLEVVTSTPLPEVELDGRRLLLVEDNPVNQEVATGMLRGLGGLVDVVNNGLEALDALEAGRYELVLMDCQMPEMDGYTATREFRRLEQSSGRDKGQRVPIVAMTAHAMAGEREKCLAAGMDDYLSKPFSQDQLRELVARWLPGVVATEIPRPDRRAAHSPGAKLRSLPVHPPAEEVELALPPPIDEVLQQRYLWGALSRESAERVIRAYLATSPELLGSMRSAAGSGDLAGLAELTHRFRSSSAMLGASHLSGLCAQTEELARSRSQEAFELVPKIDREFERVAAVLTPPEAQAAVS